jgi:hypothetical protein
MFAGLSQWWQRYPVLRNLLLLLYYVAITLALIFMYGRGDFSTPPFVYQEF